MTPQQKLGLIASGRRRAALQNHRYWRFLITGTNGSSSYILIQDCAMHATIGGANIAVGGIAAASTAAYSPASDAFDQNPSTSWQTNWAGGPQWCSYDFGSAKVVREIAVLSAGSGFTDRNMGAFQFQYSDDNSSWTTIATFSSPIWTASANTTFEIQ